MQEFTRDVVVVADKRLSLGIPAPQRLGEAGRNSIRWDEKRRKRGCKRPEGHHEGDE